MHVPPQQPTSSDSSSASQVPDSTPILVGKLLRQRKFFVQENSQVKRLDDTMISSNSTVFLRLCDDMDYIVDSVCTKIMIEECKNLNLIVNEKIITSIIEVWKSDNVNINLNSQVQTVQVDQCRNINLHYNHPNQFYSVVWNNTSQLSLKIFEDGQEKHTLENDGQNPLPSDEEDSSGDKKLNPNQYIIRLIDNKLVTEELIRAENWFPTTQREWKEWKIKVDANSAAASERQKQREQGEKSNRDEANENKTS